VQKLTKRGQPRPPHHYEHYRDAEIALVYLIQKTPEAMATLADLLGRTPEAVDLLWGWCAGRNFPKTANNQIKRQVERVKQLLGPTVKGQVAL
jgi:hypothetical protein